MNFKESLKNIKLDLTNLILVPSGGSGGDLSSFEISSKDFLKYAKEDLHTRSDRSTINSLSNAKRAIDCQVDEVFCILGIDYQDLPKSLEPFVNCFELDNNLPFKLK